MPIAQADAAATLTGIPVTIAALANDLGSGLTIVGHTQPIVGTVALNLDQTFTYTPPLAFEGADSFAYTVRDAAGGTALGEVTIAVTRPNAAPVARADTAEVDAGASVLVAVLANDNDPDGDLFGIVGIDAPGHGTIQVEPGQQVRYTPQLGFSGIDGFTYTVSDGRGGADTAHVTVTVVRPNLPPQPVSDMASTLAGTPVAIDALANDNDPDGDPIALAGMTLPGHGTLTLTPDQRLFYAPNDGFVGSDGFSYTVRDSHGAQAEAAVRVNVAPRNAPPIATADIATSIGEPVAINPIANDNDPDGDPLRLTALTLPLKGRIAVDAAGIVTYTPPAGFAGNDTFTYRVSDGRAEAEGDVTVNVTAPTPPTFANGYRNRRRIVMPARVASPETASDFVLLVRETDAVLKSVANGGKVESVAGFDLRFELEDGTKLDHELSSFEPATGALLAWVRIPSLDLASQLRLLLYYGKPGLTIGEANAAGVWRGYLAVYDARTGADRTGQGRALTPSNVAAGVLIGDAGRYDGAAVASRGDATFLDGRPALTVQAMVSADTAMLGSDHGLLAQGPMDGSDAVAGLTLQYRQRSNDGAPNVVHFKVACADGGAFVLSGANTQRAGAQLLHGAWRQGEVPRLFIDGTEVEPSATSEARSGATSMAAGGLYVGAGARDPVTGGWHGLIDEVRIAAAAFSAARIASEAANLLLPQGLYGLGGEDQAGESDQSPVAVPMRIATTAAMHVDIDVVAAAYDPDGPGWPEIAAVGAPSHGVTTAIGGKIRYTPIAGFTGQDSFAYTLDNAGKRSSSTVFLSVHAASTTAELPNALRTINITNAAQLTAALAGDFAGLATVPAGASGPLLPGDHIRLGDSTYGGTFTLSRPGTPANPIVIKAANKLAAKLTGTLNLDGNDCWAWGLDFDGQLLEGSIHLNLRGDRARAMRCVGRRWRTPASQGGGAIFLAPSGVDNKIFYCEFYDMDGRAISCDVNSDVLRPHIYGCWFHDNVLPAGSGNGREMVQFGQTQIPDGVPVKYEMGGTLDLCRFERLYTGGSAAGHDENEPVSNKSSNNRLKRLYMGAGMSGFFNIRFGNAVVTSSVYCAAGYGIGVFGDENILLKCTLAGGNPKIVIHGGNQDMTCKPYDFYKLGSAYRYELYTEGSPNYVRPRDDIASWPIAYSRPWSGSDRFDAAGNIVTTGGSLDGDSPIARRTVILGCSGTVQIGKCEDSNEDNWAALDTKIEGHTGQIQTQNNYGSWATVNATLREAGTVRQATVTTATLTAIGMTRAEYDAIPAAREVLLSEVGPNAPWVAP